MTSSMSPGANDSPSVDRLSKVGGIVMHSTPWQQSLLAVVFILRSLGSSWAEEQASEQTQEQTKEYDITEPKMSCDEANTITQRALERLHYKVIKVQPASVEKAGMVKGQRLGFWGEQEPVSVEITCGETGVHLAPRAEIPPCEQANRIMRKAVEDSGYTVTNFKPASLGGAGMVKGKREGKAPVSVTIHCAVERNRVVVDTASDSPLLEKSGFYQAFSDFQRGFYAMFRAVVDEFAYKKSAAYQSKVANMDQIQIGIVPLIPADVDKELGDKAKEVVPVRVTIFNSTTTAYHLESDKITLLAKSGKRVKPIPSSDQTLPAPALPDQTVTPGAYVEGYLFYPPGAYTGARGFLVEQERQEREGFSVEF